MQISGISLTGGFGLSAAQIVQVLGNLAVGAPFDDDNGTDSGCVYMYNLDGTGEVKITPSDGAADDQFGYSVALA